MENISRRKFIEGLAASSLLSAGHLPLSSIAGASNASQAAFISTRKLSDGTYTAAVISPSGTLIFEEKLQARGHATTVSPDKSLAVVFARRPGHFALVLDLKNKIRRQAFLPPKDHHFYGHGFFSPDGRLLYATENNFEKERGVIGIYDVDQAFKRIAAFDSHGIGPHEAILLSDGQTIAIANGGILTHPDYPRQKLNLSTMEPCISYLDRRDGKLLSQSKLPAEFYQLSLRHMCEADKGTLWLGGQYEGSPSDSISLVSTHSMGKDITPLNNTSIFKGMKHYIGSVSPNIDGSLVATSAPKGNKVAIWNSDTREVMRVIHHKDSGGVAANGLGFVISDGQGNIWQDEEPLYQDAETSWDNHLSSL